MYLTTRAFISLPSFWKGLYFLAILVAAYSAYTVEPYATGPAPSRPALTATAGVDASVALINPKALYKLPWGIGEWLDTSGSVPRIFGQYLSSFQNALHSAASSFVGGIRRAFTALDGDPDGRIGLWINVTISILLAVAVFAALQFVFFKLDQAVSSDGNVSLIFYMAFLVWTLVIAGTIIARYFPTRFLLSWPESLSSFPGYAIPAYCIILLPLPFAVFLFLFDIVKSICLGKIHHTLAFLLAAVAGLALTPVLAYSIGMLILVGVATSVRASNAAYTLFLASKNTKAKRQ